MAQSDRLISAERLVINLAKKNRFGRIEYDDIMAAIADAPTVEAVEVVHGRWKYYHKKNIAVCTNCSFERDLDVNFGTAISCPNCGAKMDEEA